MQIGIFGLGAVGMALARRLRAHGVAPFGFRRGSMAAFEDLGGTACSSPDELLDRSDVVLLCTPASALAGFVERCLARSWPTSARPVIADLGVGPLDARSAGCRQLREAGITLLDAPVMGNPPMIEAGRATLYVSGDEAVFRRIEAALGIITANAPYLGAFGHGTQLKLASNLLLAAHTVAAAEAVALCRASNLDPALLLAHLPPIARSGVLDARGTAMVQGAATQGQGSNAMLVEVIESIEGHARGLGLDLPLLAAARERFERAGEIGLAEMDTPTVVQVYGQRAP